MSTFVTIAGVSVDVDTPGAVWEIRGLGDGTYDVIFHPDASGEGDIDLKLGNYATMAAARTAVIGTGGAVAPRVQLASSPFASTQF